MAERRRSRWPWVLLGLPVGFVFAIVIVLSGTEGDGRVLVLDDEEDEQGLFVEIPVEGIIADAAVDGVNPVAWVERCLERAAEEPDLAGILLRVNSPGGGIRASDEILHALRRFKGEKGVPLVVWMKDVAASGGYYVSMASDWIVAHEDTITASIGVIWPTLNWEVLMREKLGIRFGALKSADKKDIGSPNRLMTREERALIQALVDEAYEKFVGLVVAGRAGKVTEESVKGLESTILSGRRALAAGLVDQLGFREDAVRKLKELAGIERADVIEYEAPKSLFEELFLASGPPGPLESRLARLTYLYAEGPPLLSLWER